MADRAAAVTALMFQVNKAQVVWEHSTKETTAATGHSKAQAMVVRVAVVVALRPLALMQLRLLAETAVMGAVHLLPDRL